MSNTIKNTMLFLLFLSFGFGTTAQAPLEKSRESKLGFYLNNSEKKVFPIDIQKDDELTIAFKNKRALNFSVLTPEGTVIYESVCKPKKGQNWSKVFSQEGAYQISFEDVSLIRMNEVNVSIDLKRPHFVYGSGSAKKTAILNEAKDTVVTQGTFKASYSNDKNYPVALTKGDTFYLKLEPLSGAIPEFSVTNDKGEYLHYQLTSKKPVQLQIPAFTDEVVTLTFLAPKFLQKIKRFVPGTIKIELRKHIPLRYTDTNAIVVDTISENQVYDTIAEVYIDTIVRLGAQRDITQKSKNQIKIRFNEPDEIMFWGIVYGAGPDFIQSIGKLNEKYLAENIEPIKAYCFGELGQLPKNTNSVVSFRFSQDLNDAFEGGKNYAKVEYFSDVSSINMENTSLSSAQDVYVKIVAFRQKLK
jgi:hypothetical protein